MNDTMKYYMMGVGFYHEGVKLSDIRYDSDCTYSAIEWLRILAGYVATSELQKNPTIPAMMIASRLCDKAMIIQQRKEYDKLIKRNKRQPF